MKRSTDRILTTHVGCLPRPPDLLDVVQAQEQGRRRPLGGRHRAGGAEEDEIEVHRA